MAELQLALVGGGGISRAHIAAARASDGQIRFAAVVDPAESARKGVADTTGAAPFATIEQLLASDVAKKIQGVVVCTPPSARVPIVKAALERGIAVLAEKPLAHKLPDARQLADLAAKHSNVVTAVGYCHRFTPAIIEMKRRVESGALGSVNRFENTFAFFGPAMQQKWMSDPAVAGGGSFIDTGCHSLDLFHFLVGPGKVNAAVFHREWPGRAESSATVLVESDKAAGARSGNPSAPNRVAGVINAGWLEPARFHVSVVGTKGSLSYDYDKPTELQHRPNEGSAETIAVETHDVRFQRQLESFVAAIIEKKPTKLATFGDGLKTAEMVDQAQRAAAGLI
jgi:predicted dehydrogenase